MIIDCHAYLDQRAGRRALPASISAFAQACGVDCFLVSNLEAAPSSLGGGDLDETSANVACLAASTPTPALAPLYVARPGSPGSHISAFTGALDSEPFRGVVFFSVPAPDSPAIDPYLVALRKRSLPALFPIQAGGSFTVAKVAALARRFAGVPVVMLGAGREREWPKAVEEVRRTRQRDDVALYLDTACARADEVATTVSELGPERLLFGSGATVLYREHAQPCRRELDLLRARLSADAFQKVTCDNAQQLFRLRGAAPLR